MTDPQPPSRRHVLKTGLGAAAAGLGAEARADAPSRDDLFLPEEHWRDRLAAPEDGKRFGWVVDTRRCFGCHGCEVACKAENDVPLGHFIRQTVYHDHTRASGQVARIAVPMACEHCEDAPCIKACPCGAMHKGEGGTVLVDYDACSGHAACKEACPYGAIYIDPVANQAVKCHNCVHRVAEDMEPACVSTCPSEALYFGDLNDPDSKVSRMAARLELEPKASSSRRCARDRGTRPRMQFATDAEHPLASWEPKMPAEGESYSPAAYRRVRVGRAGLRPARRDRWHGAKERADERRPKSVSLRWERR